MQRATDQFVFAPATDDIDDTVTGITGNFGPLHGFKLVATDNIIGGGAATSSSSQNPSTKRFARLEKLEADSLAFEFVCPSCGRCFSDAGTSQQAPLLHSQWQEQVQEQQQQPDLSSEIVLASLRRNVSCPYCFLSPKFGADPPSSSTATMRGDVVLHIVKCDNASCCGDGKNDDDDAAPCVFAFECPLTGWRSSLTAPSRLELIHSAHHHHHFASHQSSLHSAEKEEECDARNHNAESWPSTTLQQQRLAMRVADITTTPALAVVNTNAALVLPRLSLSKKSTTGKTTSGGTQNEIKQRFRVTNVCTDQSVEIVSVMSVAEMGADVLLLSDALLRPFHAASLEDATRTFDISEEATGGILFRLHVKFESGVEVNYFCKREHVDET